MATEIARFYINWESLRQVKMAEWQEIQRYIFATDTTKTTNSSLPWSNKTTIPKLCQIRDNLLANYMATMFPKRKWLIWEGSSPNDETGAKKKAIESYMAWVVDRNEFTNEIVKLVSDYIDYGNCFAMPEWVDNSSVLPDGKQQVGYVGPSLRRISPTDIVFNPIAPSFLESPKIIRSLVSIGELKQMLESSSITEEERNFATELYSYIKDIRRQTAEHTGASQTKDVIFNVSGFDSYSIYLKSNYVEVLTFYGDMYDTNTDTFMRNHVIKVIDRHKVMSCAPNDSYFGTAPIYHSGWRVRPDNIWAMGPLDNLVGMQYRIDHLENMKADVFDLIAYPPMKVKGHVEEFEWGPMERIYVGDDGDVTVMSPNVQALQADNQIAILENKMEEMAGSPKEAAGFRTPGEKTAYEVQRLENAASRVFTNKIAQFERQVTENGLNAMLELARRMITEQTIRLFDSEFKVADFQTLTAEEITGSGRLKPVAARHFSEQSQMVQNLNSFFSSRLGADPSVMMHFSSVELARLMENLLEIEDRNVVLPYVRISEQAEAAKLQASAQEDAHMSTTTATGFRPGDSDPQA